MLAQSADLRWMHSKSLPHQSITTQSPHNQSHIHMIVSATCHCFSLPLYRLMKRNASCSNTLQFEPGVGELPCKCTPSPGPSTSPQGRRKSHSLARCVAPVKGRRRMDVPELVTRTNRVTICGIWRNVVGNALLLISYILV